MTFSDVSEPTGSPRSSNWVWWISGLLLLATMLNYMDRQTLAVLSVRITKELSLSEENYGDLEFGFGVAFAIGSLSFGILADSLSVRWLYPIVLLSWSAIGILTGFCKDFSSLLTCRILLGFFEAGHWPCALKTTQALQTGGKRLMGNSILQSGGAIGAILTPLVVRLITRDDPTAGAWRTPFFIIGSLGVVWAGLWLTSLRTDDVPVQQSKPDENSGPNWFFECMWNPKFWALVPVVICLNITWQLIRAWLPKFLQQGRGATEAAALFFNSCYFAAADVGCIAAGAIAIWLGKKGFPSHPARIIVFACCCVLTGMTGIVPYLKLGPALYAVLLLVAAGSLGLFPCYYSMSQDVSERHLGKATGLLGALGWLISSPVQKLFGKYVDRYQSFDDGIALAGFAPLVGLIILQVVWPKSRTSST
ncbi:MAG: MFS transporter [Planctomycetaceae bacterium]|nr:MFS transporter [Planctomycetaceae bacterium]